PRSVCSSYSRPASTSLYSRSLHDALPILPVFWFALMEQWIFAQELSWLPAHGRYDPRNPLEAITHFYVLDSLLHLDFAQAGAVLKYLILPSIALGTIP